MWPARQDQTFRAVELHLCATDGPVTVESVGLLGADHLVVTDFGLNAYAMAVGETVDGEGPGARVPGRAAAVSGQGRGEDLVVLAEGPEHRLPGPP